MKEVRHSYSDRLTIATVYSGVKYACIPKCTFSVRHTMFWLYVNLYGNSVYKTNNVSHVKLLQLSKDTSHVL